MDTTESPRGAVGKLASAAFDDCERAVRDTIAATEAQATELAADLRSRGIERLVLTGDGCSYTAELACEPSFIRCAGLPVATVVTSDLPFYEGLVDDRTCVVVLSRTGERQFVLDVVDSLARRGPLLVGITGNPRATTFCSLVDKVLQTKEGPEPAFLKSKSTLAGIVSLFTLAAALGSASGDGRQLDFAVVRKLPALINEGLLMASTSIRAAAESAARCEHWAILGSGASFGAAADCALKLQEIAQVHASAHRFGFFYHGPLGTMSPQWGAVLLVSPETRPWADRVAGELAWAGVDPIIWIAAEPAPASATSIVQTPDLGGMHVASAELFGPAVQLPALYRFIYELAIARHLDPDRPPRMERMLGLILPAGQTEPDLE